MMSIREAARRLGVHDNTVRRYADRGLIRSIRLPVRGTQHSPRRRRGARGCAADRLEASLATRACSRSARLTSSERGRLVLGAEAEAFLALTYAERDRDR